MSIGQVTDVNATSIQTIKLQAAAARVKGDLVRISTGGSTGVNVDLTIADNTNVYCVAVAMQDAALGAVYEAAVKGTVDMTVPSATYTKGNGLKILDAAITDTAAAAAADTGVSTLNDFAVIHTGGTTVTSIKATLYGHAFTATT